MQEQYHQCLESGDRSPAAFEFETNFGLAEEPLSEISAFCPLAHKLESLSAMRQSGRDPPALSTAPRKRRGGSTHTSLGEHGADQQRRTEPIRPRHHAGAHLCQECRLVNELKARLLPGEVEREKMGDDFVRCQAGPRAGREGDGREEEGLGSDPVCFRPGRIDRFLGQFLVGTHDLLGQLKDVRFGVDGVLDVDGKVWQCGVVADEVAKVVSLVGLAQLDDGQDASQEHPLAMEFLHILLGCCAPPLVRISIIDTGGSSQLAGFAGMALVTLDGGGGQGSQ